MDTKKKVLIASGLLIVVGGYYIYSNMKSKSTTASEVLPEEQAKLDTKKVLSKGSVGAEVSALQKALKGGLVVDGNFGSLTEARLKAITGETSISLTNYNVFINNKESKSIKK
jgi:hypothetical protein